MIMASPPVHSETRSGDNSRASTASRSRAAVDKSRESIPTACLPCRSKHLKCDGSRPCARCLASGSECGYVASRRGYKGPRRAPAKSSSKRQPTSPPDASSENPFLASVDTSHGGPSVSSPAESSSSGRTPASSTTQAHPSLVAEASISGRSSPWRSTVSLSAPPVLLPTLAERCLDSFYQHFHAAHPFVVPRDFIFQISPPHGNKEPLMAAMRWVGSLYIDVQLSRRSLLDEALHKVLSPTNVRDVFLLQAMMVLLVGLDGIGDQNRARETLLDSEKLALEIALNTRPFAMFHGQGLPVLEESLRRTWWDLYVIDGMIAGVHRATNFALYDAPTDVPLPCEEHEYLSGNIPPPRGLEDLDERDFTDDDHEFSSFAYRILSTRNLGRYLRTQPITNPQDENITRLETLLTNWRLNLPRSKRTAIDTQGRVDEMMFQGFMINYAVSLMLHQPHSQLDASPAKQVTYCSPYREIPHGQAFNSHTRHTMTSAAEISKLITHRVSPLSHTPFFSCVISVSSIIHLSRWALHFVQYDDEDIRQQLRLNIGALNEFATVWQSAANIKMQVQAVAKEVYQAKKAIQATPRYWFGVTRETMAGTIALDDSIIEEVDGGDGQSGVQSNPEQALLTEQHESQESGS